jgi:TonB family protein
LKSFGFRFRRVGSKKLKKLWVDETKKALWDFKCPIPLPAHLDHPSFFLLMPAPPKHPKTWFVAGGFVLAAAGVIAGGWFFSKNRSAPESSLQFSLKPAAGQAMEPSASAVEAQPGDAGPAAQRQERKAPTKASTPEGLRLLERARALELGINGTPVDMQKAFALYRQAAALGSAEAWYRMGVLALGEKMDGVDARSALKFFQEAADAGYTDAYTALARAYMEGKIVKADEVRAEFYLEKAIEAGSSEAKFLKGARLVEVPGRGDEGLALLLEAARDGNADAQQTVARLYKDGKVVAQDPALAEEWLRFAIENGSSRAKYQLAELMMKNARAAGAQLTPAQTSEMVGLLTDAARDGSAAAAKALGLVMLRGGLSPENLRVVREYAEQSFDAGRADAAFLMAMTYALGKDADAAMQWLELGAADKDWRSRYARQLVREGTDVVQALRTAGRATFQEWQNKAATSSSKVAAAGITPPKIISMTAPKFPSGFASLDVKGSAVVEFVVAQDGTPQGIQVIKSTHPEFADAVVNAVKTWKLTPGKKNGKYAPIKMRFPVQFKNGI